MQYSFKNKQKDQLVFSSDDSLNSNDSFASSEEDDEKQDLSNNFLSLKDQMTNFLAQNIELQNDIKFQPLTEQQSDEENERIAQTKLITDPHVVGQNHAPENHSSKNQKEAQMHKNDINSADKANHMRFRSLDKKSSPQTLRFSSADANKENSRLWKSITKKVVRIGQFGTQTPTLETLSHRLNIFKTKIEKINYYEYLQKEMAHTAGGTISSLEQNEQNNQTQKSQEKDGRQNKSKEKKKMRFMKWDEKKEEKYGFTYYSFKKIQEIDLREKIEKYQSSKQEEEGQKKKEEDYNNGSGGRRPNIVARGIIDAKKLIIQNEMTEKKKIANSEFPSKPMKRRFTEHKIDQIKDDHHGKQENPESNLNFQSRIGIALYETYKSCGADKKDSFKKIAYMILKNDYIKNKQQFYNKKILPSQPTKFTSEEAKGFNVFLPDFTSKLSQSHKTNIFANIETSQLQANSAEAEFFSKSNKILDGPVLKFWKNSQKPQD